MDTKEMSFDEILDALVAILGVEPPSPEKRARCIALLDDLARDSYNDGYKGN